MEIYPKRKKKEKKERMYVVLTMAPPLFHLFYNFFLKHVELKCVFNATQLFTHYFLTVLLSRHKTIRIQKGKIWAGSQGQLPLLVPPDSASGIKRIQPKLLLFFLIMIANKIAIHLKNTHYIAILSDAQCKCKHFMAIL